jgi:hypothetical protein
VRGRIPQELLLVDGASLRVLVRRLCPALDALLTLTPDNEGEGRKHRWLTQGGV